MQEKATTELEKELEQLNMSDFDDYIKRNKSYMRDEREFYHYFKSVIKNKNVMLKDVYLYAGCSENYGGQILRMEKHTPHKDFIIRLCVAGHFTIDEMNRALQLYNMSPLDSKNLREACVIISVKNRKYDLLYIDECLKKRKLKPLSLE